MPRRATGTWSGGVFHAYNRVLLGERLFHSAENATHCLRLLRRYAPQQGVELLAYTLMPTHYHLLLRQTQEVPVARYLSVVFNAYVQALNRQLERRGPLFCGRFGLQVVRDDDQLLQAARYIHLNAVKAGIALRPDDWPHSDYAVWCARPSGDPSGLLEGAAYRRFVEEE